MTRNRQALERARSNQSNARSGRGPCPFNAHQFVPPQHRRGTGSDAAIELSDNVVSNGASSPRAPASPRGGAEPRSRGSRSRTGVAPGGQNSAVLPAETAPVNSVLERPAASVEGGGGGEAGEGGDGGGGLGEGGVGGGGDGLGGGGGGSGSSSAASPVAM